MADEAFAPRGVRLALSVLGLTLAAYTLQASFALGGSAVGEAFAAWVYTFLAVGASGVCLVRVVLVKPERAAWSAFFIGLASWTTADALWLVDPSSVAEPPLLWLTDVLYLTMYPAF